MNGPREIRVALADAIREITGIQVNAYLISNPTPPSADVVYDGVEYDEAMNRGADWYSFLVRVFAAQNLDRGSQDLLDEFLAPDGARSIKENLEVDRTLGGVVDSLHVTEATGYQLVAPEGHPGYMTVTWTVRILV